MTRVRLMVLVSVLCLTTTVAAGAAWLLFTASGTRFLVTATLSRVLPARRFSIGRMSGTLRSGMAFEGIVIEGIKGMPADHQLLIDRLDVKLSLRQPVRSRIQGRYLSLSVPGLVSRVTVAKVTGSPRTGWRLSDLEAQGLRGLPEGARLAVQGVELSGTDDLSELLRRGRIAVANARLQAPEIDPIVLDGSWIKGRLSLNAYTNSLTPEEVRPFFPTSVLLRVSSGAVGNVQAHLTGDWQRPDVEASFVVQHLSRKGFVLSQAPGTFTGSLARVGRGTDVHGTLLLRRGKLVGRDTSITLQPSRLLFAGNVRNPAYDVKGTAMIAGTTIRITLRGTRVKPELLLASSPQLPQQRLLLMLATGRSLAGTESHLDEGEISSDLAADFIDYLMFGGQGSRLAQRVGITGFSLMYQPETNTVGLKTTLADKLSLTYQAEQPRADERLPEAGSSSFTTPTEHRLGVEYKVTDTTSVKVEGERELLPPASSESGTPSLDQTGPASETRDELRLKLERRF